MPTIEERARDLLNEAAVKRGSFCRWGNGDTRSSNSYTEALCRALEAHDATLAEFEAFKREVSDEAERILNCTNVNKRYAACLSLSRFIIPKPVDPLVEAVKDCGYAKLDAIEPEFAADLRAALAKRGGRIVFEEVGDEL